MNLFFNVKVKPNAKETILDKIDIVTQCFELRVKASPVQGQANEDVIRFFKRFFKITLKQIVIKSGETSKQKRLSLNVDSPLTFTWQNTTYNLTEEGLSSITK